MTLDVERVALGKLKVHPANPNDGDVAGLADSLQTFGQWRPAVVQRSTGHVLIGNTMLRAAQSLHWPAIDVHWRDVDDDTALRILLRDNKTRDQARYDERALAELLARFDGELDGTGWAVDETAELLRALEEADQGTDSAPPSDEEDEPPIAPPKEPLTRPGDVWELGPHRIICGDCRDPETLSRLLGDQRINVAFTSPPYASQREYDPSSGFRPIPPDAYSEWFDGVQQRVADHLADDGSWFVNIRAHADGGQRHLYVHDLVADHVRKWGWRFVDDFCWVDAANGIPGGWPNRFKDAWEPVYHFCRQAQIKFRPLANGTESESVFAYSSENTKSGTGSGLLGAPAGGRGEGIARPSNVLRIASANESYHSAAFPIALPAWFIRAFSDPGDLVFDPFMGSGTTLIAAHRFGRIGMGAEVSAGYCDVILHRFQRETGIKPCRVEGDDGLLVPYDFMT